LIREKDENSFEFINNDMHKALSLCIFDNPNITGNHRWYYYGDLATENIRKYVVHEKITLSYLLKYFSKGPLGFKTIDYVKKVKTSNPNMAYGHSFPFKGYFQKVVSYLFTKKQTDAPLFFGQKITDEIFNVQLNGMLNPPPDFFQKSFHHFSSDFFDRRRYSHDIDVSNLIVIWRKNLMLPPISCIMQRTSQSPEVTIDLIKECVMSQYPTRINSADDIQIKTPLGGSYNNNREKIYFGILNF